MDTAKLNDWLQVIGIFAVVASLLFVGLQMKQSQNIAIVETFGDISESTQHLTNLVERNTDLWSRGLDGEGLSQTDQITFDAMAESVENHFLGLWIRYSFVGPRIPEYSARNYAYALYVHPGLRRLNAKKWNQIKARETAFDLPTDADSFQIAIDNVLGQLDERSPVIPKEKRYIFWLR